MANYSELLNDINAAIYENNGQEIDALEVRAILREMVTSLGSGFLFKGIATPSSPSGTGTYEPDQNVFYLATTAGTYTYLGGLVVAAGEVAFLCFDGTWTKKSSALLSTGGIVDNLTTSDATKPLSAKQGKVLKDGLDATSAELTALGQKVDGLALGKFYGFFPVAADLPAGDDAGYAYVGASAPFAIYVFEDGAWSDSGSVYSYPVANGEDIDLNEDGELQFANRTSGDGMGYKILRKDATFASQVTENNTIYEIRYDFALATNFTMPENCVLFFNGGKISGAYSITGKRTLVAGRLVDIFDGVSLVGTLVNESCNLCWWGAKSTDDAPGFDNTDIIKTALKTTIRRIYVSKKYGISSPINISGGQHHITGDSIRNFKQCGFVANSDFSGESITLARDGVTYNVTGMFYHSYDQAVYLSGLCFDANKKAGYCIEHLAGYSAPFLDGVYLENSLDANIVQYGCENPIFKDVRSVNSRIGLFIGSHKINVDKPYTHGTFVSNANIISLYNVSASGCNYGIVLESCSNVGLVNCNTSWNSIAGLICDSPLVADNFYSEGDGLCRFYIDSAGVKHTNSSGDAYSAPELVSGNLDGYPTFNTANPYKTTLYMRAPIWVFRQALFNELYTSVIPRSFKTGNVTAAQIEAPNERNANGVDGVIISIGAGCNINRHTVYLSNTNADTLGQTRYTYISMGINNYSPVGRFSVNGVSLNAQQYSPVIYIMAVLGYAPNSPNYKSLLNSLDYGLPISFNQMGRKLYGAPGSRFDWREKYGVREIYNGVPLFEVSPGGVLYFRLTKAEVAQFFGGQMQILSRHIVKVLTSGTYRVQLDARVLDAGGVYVATVGGSGGTVQLDAGYYEMLSPVMLEHYNAEWALLQVSLNIGDPANIITSEPLFYKIGDPLSPPSYRSYRLESGTTAERPGLPNVGDTYFDKSLSPAKEIVWNGSAWVNMDGTAL